MATLPAYLNALTGRGVHVVTVNDYLARRDAERMGQVHRFLGLSVGLIQQGMTPHPPRQLLLQPYLRHQQRAGLKMTKIYDNMYCA